MKGEHKTRHDETALKAALKGAILLLAIASALSIVATSALAANDPGHDTLYIEQQGSSELNGSINVTNQIKISNLFYSSYLDILGNGTQPSGSQSQIYAENNNLYLNSPTGLYLLQGAGSMVYVGTSSVDLNVSRNAYIYGDLYVTGPAATVGGQNICLANGTGCPTALGGANISGAGSTNYVALWTAGDTLGDSAIIQEGTNIVIGGTTDPLNMRLHGGINASGLIYEANGSRVCTSENGLCAAAGGNGNVSSTGTANYIPVFTSNSLLENSIMSQSGSTITVAGNISMPTGFFIGNSASATGAYATAIGYQAKALGQDSIALTRSTVASGSDSVAIGRSANATGNYGIAIGQGSKAETTSVIAIGVGSSSNATYSIAIGLNAKVDKGGVDRGIAIGDSSYSYAESVAIGYDAESNRYSTAIGMNSKASGVGATVISGYASTAEGDNAIAIGLYTNASGDYGIAIGRSSIAASTYATAIGYLANVSNADSIAVGRSSTTTSAQNAIAIGTASQVSTNNGIAIGSNSISSNSGIAMGFNSAATASASLALGQTANSASGYGIALGYYANSTASGNYATAVGYYARTAANYAIAIGTNANATSSDSVVIGRSAVSTSENQITIGAVAVPLNMRLHGGINASGLIYEANGSRVCTADNGLCGNADETNTHLHAAANITDPNNFANTHQHSTLNLTDLGNLTNTHQHAAANITGQLSDSQIANAATWNTKGNVNFTSGESTAGYLPLWQATGVLNNSAIYQNGTSIGIGTTSPGTYFTGTPTLDIVSSTESSTAYLGIGGNMTSDGAVGDINFYNVASPINDKRIGVIRVSRSGADNSSTMTQYVRNSNGAWAARIQATTNDVIITLG
ncbi:hypothetical protein JW826_06455 [Candidatus Woesearchaeota archaeon]|nr:hypothetical protein [Candidatus Woesearchaeota archaeon]